METQIQNPPRKIARFSGTGQSSFGDNSWDMEKEEEVIRVGLGLGLGLEAEVGSGSGVSSPTLMKSCSGFTMFQLHELHLQSAIYKYIEAGLPVPHQLVLPIWKCVAAALSDLSGGLNQLYPSFMGQEAYKWDAKHGVDEEPGRCKRTDGKKWRCSKEAVLHHKYCEKHIHRGKHRRSKKLAVGTRV